MRAAPAGSSFAAVSISLCSRTETSSWARKGRGSETAAATLIEPCGSGLDGAGALTGGTSLVSGTFRAQVTVAIRNNAAGRERLCQVLKFAVGIMLGCLVS